MSKLLDSVIISEEASERFKVRGAQIRKLCAKGVLKARRARKWIWLIDATTNIDIDLKDVITVKEASILFKKSRNTILMHCNLGSFEARKAKPRLWLIDKKSATAYYKKLT